MLHYWILCRCGHHDTTPVPGGKPKLRAEVLRAARCSRCGAKAAEDMRILWDASGAAVRHGALDGSSRGSVEGCATSVPSLS